MKPVRLDDLSAGDVIVADAGFDCMPEGRHVVRRDHHRKLFVICSAGCHYLEGQLRDDGTLVGFFIEDKVDELQ